MRRVSPKRAKRNREAKPVRDQLLREVDRCDICGDARPLCEHEIARGADRDKALDKRYAMLVLCWRCHNLRVHGNEDWPEARQLAALKRARRGDHDLAAYHKLVGYGPNRLTEEEVSRW